MRHYRNITPLCMAAAIAVLTSVQARAGSPEFARTAEEWAGLRDNTMEYGELAGLIHEYNVTVQSNQLDMNKKQLEGNLTSGEIAQSYRDAANSLRASMSGDSEAGDLALEVQARSMEMQADNNVSDMEIYRMTYEQAESNLVMTAQNYMISYFQKLSQLSADEKNRETLEAAYNSVVVRKNVEMATQMDVLNARKSLQDAEADLAQQRADIKKLKQTMCVMLGWNYDASPEIPGLPATDLTRIDGMNPVNDRAKALENNHTWKINKRKLQNTTSDITRETLNTAVKDNEQKIGSDLNVKYQAVLQSKTSYDQAVVDLSLAAQKMQAADVKIKLGAISPLEYLQEQNNYTSKQTAVSVADRNLFKAMETYDWAVKGLASAE